MKEYLLRGWNADQKVRARENHLEELRDRMAWVRSSAPRGLAGDRRGPGKDWTDAVDALADAEALYVREIAELCRVKREVRDAVTGVSSEIYRELLNNRYVFCMEWEAIANLMEYDVRYLHKLHDKALKELERLPEVKAAMERVEEGHE